MAPIIWALKEYRNQLQTVVCVTGQHREMLDQMLTLLGVKADHDLDLMHQGQTLAQLTARLLTAVDHVLEIERPDWVLVQGDTTTAMSVSLAAFYRGIRIAHVEAGLRTTDKWAPFPEEVNRRITSVVADVHFAPTDRARDSLLREGVPATAIHVTGNTVIDTLLWMVERNRTHPPTLSLGLTEWLSDRKLILVTGHRRESFGPGFEEICLALKEIVRRAPDVCVVYPVHLNPNVREPVHRILSDVERVRLVEPLGYPEFVWLMSRCYLVLTDSGGIQEEAPSLGKPVLVMRTVTERPEGVTAGSAYLVGAERDQIVTETLSLLTDRSRYERMIAARNPYGDGRAAQRILEILHLHPPERHG